ncbi:MAG: sigma-54 dependent transcriptional regulator [Myxococcota bacterium]|jgi:two-component system response regulator HydG|nr:sigma-54 dependent transcriptional regulator [Myxococcota bacterium]
MSAPTTILVVDDERSNRASLGRILARAGYDVVEAASGAEALDRLRSRSTAVLLTDLKMPGMDGVELLRAARLVSPDIEVVLMTAYGTVETAVEAMKEGAYDFLTKPLKRHDVLQAVSKAVEKRSLVVENRELRARLKVAADAGPLGRIVGNSVALRSALEVVRQVAPTDATVLVSGESGTGKELVARAIHELSPRTGKPLVRLACAALPETLLESELFGHEAGAFTGAAGKRQGRFETADGGSLLLDEVSETSPATQVKLLRVLQEGEFERVGGSRTLSVDVRIIAATNRDLEEMVAERSFREDLFYRLNVIRLDLPPLRNRAGDVPLLVDHFVRLYAERHRKPVEGVDAEAMDLLDGYRWPGNVRELQNTLERAVVLAQTDRLSATDLPESIRGGERRSDELSFPVGTPLKEVERRMILETLRTTGGDKKLAASLLGIHSRTIYRRMEEERARESGDSEE